MSAAITIDELIHYLTTWHLDAFGGYEHDHCMIDGHLVVADLDDSKGRCKTEVKHYTPQMIAEWLDEANALLELEFDGDVVDCLIHTEPEPQSGLRSAD